MKCTFKDICTWDKGETTNENGKPQYTQHGNTG